MKTRNIKIGPSTTEQLYVVSLFAWNPGLWSMRLDLWVGLATSEREADERGKRKALRQWPGKDGWRDHNTRAQCLNISFVPEVVMPCRNERETDYEFIM